MLYEAVYIGKLNLDPNFCELWPGVFQFGSNGSLEAIGFDVRVTDSWPIVVSDPIAGIEYAEDIATCMADFIQAIGIDDEVPES